MKKDHYAPSTIEVTGRRLRLIAKSADLDNPQEITKYLANNQAIRKRSPNRASNSKKDWKDIARLQLSADALRELDYPESERMFTRLIETYNKTRTITIRGKNFDDLDLEKIAGMTQQANENSSKVNLKGLLKKLKK